MLTFGSLFAGIGGFDLGFERAGLRCEWQVEINHWCRRVLAKHWPDVERYCDVREFPPDADYVLWRPDVICGGFPCKQTSNAAAIHGRRNGLAGRDSGLWYEYLRIVDWLRPPYVVVENTAGSLAWSAEIEDGLEGFGYSVQRVEIEAWDFGAPHHRRRMLWVANRYGKRLAFTRPQRSSEIEREPGRTAERNPWLSSLTRVYRVDDGVPGGMDRRKRIEACGNAVVPAIAEWVGRQLIELTTNSD